MARKKYISVTQTHQTHTLALVSHLVLGVEAVGGNRSLQGTLHAGGAGSTAPQQSNGDFALTLPLPPAYLTLIVFIAFAGNVPNGANKVMTS